MDYAVSCTRRLEWDSMHRIKGHAGKCKNFHGHRYVAEITCSTRKLDDTGMVVDFGVIKSIVGAWIDQNWDHTGIFSEQDDSVAIEMIKSENMNNGSPVYFMKSEPTAENIAKELADVSCVLLKKLPIVVDRVVIWETPNCYAEWSRS